MKHGGDITDLQKRLGDAHRIIDLSTGINPRPFDFTPPLPNELNALPSHEVETYALQAARRYYRADESWDAVLVPGTQVSISILPFLLQERISDVGIFAPTYSEYEISWRPASVNIHHIHDFDDIESVDLIYICNPNNPTGRLIEAQNLVELAKALPDTIFVFDEAFMDCFADKTLVCHEMMDNVVVLRSFGKFFGLAGVRLGLFFANPYFCDELRLALGPWSTSTFSLKVSQNAYTAVDWQRDALANVTELQNEFKTRLEKLGLHYAGGTPLYTLIEHSKASSLHKNLADNGIWTRIFDYDPNWIRFGTPANHEDLEYVIEKMKLVMG